MNVYFQFEQLSLEEKTQTKKKFRTPFKKNHRKTAQLECNFSTSGVICVTIVSKFNAKNLRNCF